MERSSRLRRYQRKDYTQLVDFPVEIVGRDGQVRRYSYDASVRLYQRRVRSAPVRYDDSELIAAECRHCRQRIEQLRRSYVERNGWGGGDDGPDGGLLSTPLAAEVLSFLRRVFPGDVSRGALSAALPSAGSGEVRWFRQSEGGRVFFLYLWRLDGASGPSAREDWREHVRRLSRAPAGESVERLFVLHEGPDLALVLAGTGDWSGPSIGAPPEDVGPPEEAAIGVEDGDPWAAGQRALHEGAVAEAVRILEQGMEAMPLRKSLPQAVALLALLDNQPDRAEYAARFGAIGHPTDVLLFYLLGVAIARQGRLDEVSALYAGAPAQTAAHPELLRSVLMIQAGNFPGGLIRLLRIPSGALVATTERCRRGLLARFIPFVGSLAVGALAVLGCLLSLDGEPDALLRSFSEAGMLLALVGLGCSAVILRIRALRILVGRAPAEARLVSLDLLPREREAEGEN